MPKPFDSAMLYIAIAVTGLFYMAYIQLTRQLPKKNHEDNSRHGQ